MNNRLTKLQQRIETLRHIHIKLVGSFNAFEQILEFRAPNIQGTQLAKAHAKAIGAYGGFFNTAQNALNTEIHISLAKIFDTHPEALHIEKLLRYTEQNHRQLTASQKESIKSETSDGIIEVYEGLSPDDLATIREDLDAVAEPLERLKTIRDKAVAHIDLSGQSDLPSLTFGEMADLISLSEKILNLISTRYYGNAAWFDSYASDVALHSHALLELVAKSEGITEERIDH